MTSCSSSSEGQNLYSYYKPKKFVCLKSLIIETSSRINKKSFVIDIAIIEEGFRRFNTNNLQFTNNRSETALKKVTETG